MLHIFLTIRNIFSDSTPIDKSDEPDVPDVPDESDVPVFAVFLCPFVVDGCKLLTDKQVR